MLFNSINLYCPCRLVPAPAPALARQEAEKTREERLCTQRHKHALINFLSAFSQTTFIPILFFGEKRRRRRDAEAKYKEDIKYFTASDGNLLVSFFPVVCLMIYEEKTFSEAADRL